MRNQENNKLEELLKSVTFTKEKAFVLTSYAFICTLCGLMAFAYLVKANYVQVQEELCAKVSSALQAATLIDQARPESRVLEWRHAELGALKPLGRELRQQERSPLIKVKGQRRQLTAQVDEVRFIEQP